MDETRNINILFADDNYLSREIAKCLNAEDGISRIVPSGKAAIEAVKARIQDNDHFDLIFLFDVIKGMEGFEILKQIRFLENQFRLSLSDAAVIVMVTKHNENSSFLPALYKDCDYFMQLPFDRLKLAIIVETTKNDAELKMQISA